MPKGPNGEKRPAGVIDNAIKVARIATGEESEEPTDSGKDKADGSLEDSCGESVIHEFAFGRRGGKARASKRWQNKT